WPGTSRTWDYRCCWLSEAALAGRALLRAGMYGEAVSIGAFIGNAVQANGPRPVVRVDGTKPPPETVRPELGGYRGARPARVGNAASGQVQMDVPGEVIELAADLADAHGLPPSLAAAATTLADWAAAHWTDPDHGVWEIRGEPRAYSHSRVMAVVGLERAAAMASRGVISPGTSDWRGEGRVIRDSVLGSSPAALELHGDGGGADAALAEITLSGFLPAGDPRAQRTLDLITQRLDRNGLIDRHEPSADASADPCGPVILAPFA